jgi:glycosyltransferase involved in cell wall biosynthesis
MRVQIVDPLANTPPYDHALSAALARAGAEVELVTSRFVYGPAPTAAGYEVSESFYRYATGDGRSMLARRGLRVVEHVPGMLRLRARSRDADLVHYQWLTMPRLDRHLLATGAPRVLTVHFPVPERGAWLRRLLERMDAVVAHSEHGAQRLRALGANGARTRVIPHGTFDYLTRLEDEVPLPPELAAAAGPVVLCFGLIRPYKGIDVLLEAFRAVTGAELWIVGMPRMPLEPLRQAAARCGGTVRFVPRFITDPEIPAYFRRADLVALPYLEAEQSGVLYTGLAFGKPMVVSRVGGFGEVADDHGAAYAVPPGDPIALAEAVESLIADAAARERLATAAARAAAGPYSWDSVAQRTLALYRELVPK